MADGFIFEFQFNDYFPTIDLCYRSDKPTENAYVPFIDKRSYMNTTQEDFLKNILVQFSYLTDDWYQVAADLAFLGAIILFLVS